MVVGISVDGTVVGEGVAEAYIGVLLQPAVAVNATTRTTVARDDLGFIIFFYRFKLLLFINFLLYDEFIFH